jgi:hypothetical protein
MRALAFSLLAAAVAVALPVVRELHKAVPAGGGRVVSIMHRYGRVDVVGGENDSFRVDAVARVDGIDRRHVERFARDIELSLAAWSETVFVSVLYPDLPEPSAELSYEVDLGIAVPRSAALVAVNSFGDVKVAGLDGGCRVENKFGNVGLDACRDCDVKSRYGDVHATATTGRLKVNNSYGSVFLDEAGETVRVDNSYGNVEGTNLEGEVFMGNVFGNVVSRGGRGQLVIANRFGDVDAWVEDTGLTELDVQAQLGRVHLNVARLVPFRIGGRTIEGIIRTGLPVRVCEEGSKRWISGQSGKGGPSIQFTGAWADFIIGPDSEVLLVSESLPGVRLDSAGDRR